MGGIDPNGLALRDRLDLGGEQPDFDTWLAGKNGDSASIEAWLARAGDDPVPVSVVTSGLPGDLPGERHHVCVIEDLRQTRALDAERRRAAHQKELLIMAAEWAHDVRTPLTGILHSAELVAGAVDPASPKLRHLGTIRTEVERINDLVNNFLDYAKPVQLKRGVGDLAQLAEQVVHLLAGPALASSRRLELVIDDGADRCPVRLDADKMKRALLNLVQNALEATPLGSQVTVRVGHGFEALEGEAQPPRRCAVLEVIDAGNGVPDEHLDRLFVPFFTTKPKGTGLGLAISEKIVRAHEGTLRYLRRDSQTILRALVPLHFSVQETGDELREIEARG
jgi:two-component system nitrogen regulation sensor histidine kinase GlnL